MNIELIKKKVKNNISVELVKENDMFVVYYIECDECLSSVCCKTLKSAKKEYNDIIL